MPKRKRPHVAGPKPGYPGTVEGGTDGYDPEARVVKRKEAREIKPEVMPDMRTRPIKNPFKNDGPDPYLEAS